MAVQYGEGDASFQAAGGLEGLRKLVDRFYQAMDELPEAKAIRAMHPRDLTVARDKLTLFLSGWLGGEKLFSKTYGPIIIPVAHAHLDIDEPERDAWLACMQSQTSLTAARVRVWWYLPAAPLRIVKVRI